MVTLLPRGKLKKYKIMFKKIVSNISFSPALVGQLGFYAKRLRQEESVRRTGLIFTALALVVQSFAVFSPVEPVNAASNNDFIRGGISTKSMTPITDFLSYYDKNSNGIKDFYDKMGITRSEILSMKNTTLSSTDKSLISWGRKHKFSASQGEREYKIQLSSGGETSFFARPLWRFDSSNRGSTYSALQGYSKKFGWFAILKNCANFVSKKYPPVEKKCPIIGKENLLATDPNCKEEMCKAPGKENLRKNDPNCKVDLCTINGKTTLPKSDPNCKEDMCRITGKESLKLNDPNCKEDMCKLTGKTTLRATDPNCKEEMCKVPGKESLKATDPNCKVDTFAYCSAIDIVSTEKTQTIQVQAVSGNADTIKGYEYTIKNGSKVVTKKTTTSSVATDAITIITETPGTYEVTAAVITKNNNTNKTAYRQTTANTSQSIEKKNNCVKAFKIAEPEKCRYNTSLLAKDTECQPCSGDDSLWIKDQKCVGNLISTKTAENNRTNKPAASTIAKSGDKITYKVNIENNGKAEKEAMFSEELEDVLEYATLTDLGGGSLDKKTGVLTWPKINLKAGEKQTRIFTVQVRAQIPSTPQGVSHPTSYDCKMTNAFGNTVEVAVACPVAKQVEKTITSLPKTGASENMIFAGALLSVAAFFYARTRQMRKEVKLIRRNINSGSI